MIEDEVSMAKRPDGARPTARRALQDLAEKCLVSRRRGVGTRVTPSHMHRVIRLSSLCADPSEAGVQLFDPPRSALLLSEQSISRHLFGHVPGNLMYAHPETEHGRMIVRPIGPRSCDGRNILA